MPTTGRKAYDDEYRSGVAKNDIGAYVRLRSGYKLLFAKGSRWRWVKISGHDFLEVEENGEVAFHAPMDTVECVGGDQVLVRDAFWK